MRIHFRRGQQHPAAPTTRVQDSAGIRLLVVPDELGHEIGDRLRRQELSVLPSGNRSLVQISKDIIPRILDDVGTLHLLRDLFQVHCPLINAS